MNKYVVSLSLIVNIGIVTSLKGMNTKGINENDNTLHTWRAFQANTINITKNICDYIFLPHATGSAEAITKYLLIKQITKEILVAKIIIDRSIKKTRKPVYTASFMNLYDMEPMYGTFDNIVIWPPMYETKHSQDKITISRRNYY